MPRKLTLLWLKDTDGFWFYTDAYPDAARTVRSLQWLNQLYYFWIALLAGGSALLVVKALVRDRRFPVATLLFSMPIFVSLLSMVFTGQHRYHFSAMPWIFLAASWFVVDLVVGARREATPVGSLY